MLANVGVENIMLKINKSNMYQVTRWNNIERGNELSI